MSNLIKALLFIILSMLMSGCASLEKSGWFTFLFGEQESGSMAKQEDFWHYGYGEGYEKGITDCKFDVAYCGKCSQNWSKYLKDYPKDIPQFDSGRLSYYSASETYDVAYKQGYYSAYESCRKELSYYCSECLDMVDARPSGRFRLLR